MTGRPTWIPTDSICEQSREMASRGLTVSQISDCLGISESTLYGKHNARINCVASWTLFCAFGFCKKAADLRSQI